MSAPPGQFEPAGFIEPAWSFVALLPALIGDLIENWTTGSRKGAAIAKMDEDPVGKEVVDAAIALHGDFGP